MDVTVDDRLAFKAILSNASRTPPSLDHEEEELVSTNPLFASEKQRLSQLASSPPPVTKQQPDAADSGMGGNFGLLQDGDDDDDEDGAGRWPCFGPDRTCTRAGWRAFFRALQCPCARPRTLKSVKNASELKTITLQVPTPAVKNRRPDNVVVTSKYTVWDFLPRAMALQFRRGVNVFYLFQVCLLIIGYYFPKVFESPFTPFGTLMVLGFVLGVTLITEFKDDRGRHRQDAVTNGKRVIRVKKNRKHQATTWGDLLPGDYVLLKNRELVPADVLVVETSNSQNGLVYIETSGIDGETNLKIRRAPSEFAALHHPQELPQGVVSYEEPNPFLGFSGSFTPANSAKAIPLAFDNLILRGSEVRNTAWALCLVMYAGHETKLILSKRATPSKFSTMDYLINRIVVIAIVQLLIMMAISLACLFGAELFPNTSELWYFHYTDTTEIFLLPSGVAFALTFFVIYGNVVPIDLYVVMEVATGLQSWFLCRDLEMYDPVTDTPAGSKSTSLISEIGQVSHVFSDKTGTLTQNVMRLVGCSLAGKRFGVKVPDATQHEEGAQFSSKDTDEMNAVLGKRTLDYSAVFADLLTQVKSNRAAAEFLLILAVCHTVVMDVDEQGLPRYNAEGPDEEALVKASAALGMVLRSTDTGLYKVYDEHHQSVRSFKVLGVNGFNSDRKRMSVVVQDVQSGEFQLLLKGADSVVAERSRNMSPQLQADLDAFAQVGLRTLLVAVKRNISATEVAQWQRTHDEAKLLIGQAKIAALDAVADQFERDLEVVGATAIEDALQEGVPETIRMLREAQIKVWVLTGDKVDTAVNIGFSSKLLDSDMHQIFIDGSSTAALEAKLDEYLAALQQAAEAAGVHDAKNNEDAWTSKNLALVLTGRAVEYLLAKQKGSAVSQQKLVSLANACSVVLACRVSPAQKALIVRASTQSARKRGSRPVVSLAIGDGANDVPMIQEARIGVGISGKEGLQAVNSADFSIAQFRFLQRMLFVHGRWSYKRNSTLLLYVCYSWQVLNWPIFLYMFYCMFSGQQLYYQTFYITIFAWVMHNLPLLNSFLEQDMKPSTVMAHPEAYDLGRLNLMLTTYKIIFGMFVKSLVHSCLFFFVLIHLFPSTHDMSTFGSYLYIGLCVVTQAVMAQVSLSFNWAYTLLFLMWFVLVPVAITVIESIFGDTPLMGTHDFPFVYANVFLLFGVIVLYEYCTAGARRLFYPNVSERLMEVDRGHVSVVGELKQMGGVAYQGMDNTVFLTAKAIRHALLSRRSQQQQQGNKRVDVEVEEMHRPHDGYVDSSPRF